MRTCYRLVLVVLCLLQLNLKQFVAAYKIDDCVADQMVVQNENSKGIFALLQEIRRTRFFRIFKVNINKECTLWEDVSVCYRPTCAVHECNPDEIPRVWYEEMSTSEEECADDRTKGSIAEPNIGGPVDRTLDVRFQEFTVSDDTWIVQDDDPEMAYIDLQMNPEGYTGFSGAPARRIWSAIYGENCFKSNKLEDLCLEERFFFRLLSGMQACVAAHIAANYPQDDGYNGYNLPFFQRTVGDHPERITNIYFTYVVLLRALNKAAPTLKKFDYFVSDDPKESQRTKELILKLLQTSLVSQCSSANSFDETSLFNNPASITMKNQFRSHFRNISRILDCIGCEKCRLHSKLQIFGLGTALQILFNENPKIHRNQLVALINTLGKFSNGIDIILKMQQLNQKQDTRIAMYIGVLAFIFATFLALVLRVSFSRSSRNKNKKAD
eukprot:TRINITY_DN11501_c0_g1_i2.p1 TRINITY_DN11501_c0_g1~~TRINITY_DN11501_c0_g1_i2.p1  ORF type:complete len:440 (-),score=118.92 TRINITY_DN11501_c0_g1_i2:44-1363(-)